jgi:hypothetical protein
MYPRYGSEILISDIWGAIADVSGNRYNVDVYDTGTD